MSNENLNSKEEVEEWEGNQRSQRQTNLSKIEEDIKNIDGVSDAEHTVSKPHYVDARLNLFLECEETAGYRIRKSLKKLNSEIKDVLSKHDDKHEMDDVGFRSPELKTNGSNIYENNVYAVELMMK